jgi:hypothetical protein
MAIQKPKGNVRSRSLTFYKTRGILLADGWLLVWHCRRQEETVHAALVEGGIDYNCGALLSLECCQKQALFPWLQTLCLAESPHSYLHNSAGWVFSQQALRGPFIFLFHAHK